MSAKVSGVTNWVAPAVITTAQALKRLIRWRGDLASKLTKQDRERDSASFPGSHVQKQSGESARCKLAHGFADDALTSIVLATEAPLLLAPAMNGKMWMHPATVANVEILRQRGANFIGPEKGILACGYEGIGRLWPVDEIVAKALEYKKR